jgi:hypothetical protein
MHLFLGLDDRGYFHMPAPKALWSRTYYQISLYLLPYMWHNYLNAPDIVLESGESTSHGRLDIKRDATRRSYG